MEGKFKHKVFSNDAAGFASFVAWFLSLCGDARPLICMEATGSYSLPLADYLVNHGFSVSLVNPAKIHAFAKSELSRAKTDKADAKLIARYAFMTQPPLWIPPPANIRELQALVRRVEHLLEMVQMEQNRLETADASTTLSITNVLKALETELKSTRQAIKGHIGNNPGLKQRSDLLETIPGIGEAYALRLPGRPPLRGGQGQRLHQPHRTFQQHPAPSGVASGQAIAGLCQKAGKPYRRHLAFCPPLQFFKA